MNDLNPGDLVRVHQDTHIGKPDSVEPNWVEVHSGLVIDYFHDDKNDSGVISILSSAGAIERFDLNDGPIYAEPGTKSKRKMWRVEVISEENR